MKKVIIMIMALLAFSFLVNSSETKKEGAATKVKVRKGEVNVKVTIDAPEESKDVRLWIPYPVTDDEQTIKDIKVNGNFSYSGIYRVKETGNLALYADWTEPMKERVLYLSFEASAIERIKKDFPSVKSDMPVEIHPYLKSTRLIPTDGKIGEIAHGVTRWKWGVKNKARAVYDWVVENTTRDPNVRGCGIGDVEMTLAKKGGKCADISTVFVAVARAAGVPAREVFGLRLGKKGGTSDMTKGHHCWSEFYLPGYGWVPVDPADVRKAMLKEGLDLKQAEKYREYFFGAVDEYRIVLGRGGRGHYLNPPQKDGPLNYFMYPYAEVDGKALEWLAAPKKLKHQITFKEITSTQAESDNQFPLIKKTGV